MEATKQWWGPRIWRILHCMAEFSDRSDCGLLWRNVLLATANILPCALCKAHLQTSLGHLSLAQPRPATVMRGLLRHFLWTLHQSSATVGISEESLTGLYGGTRATVLQSVRQEAQVIDETFRRLHILDRHHEGGLRVWVQAIHHLTRLLLVLEPPPLVGRRRR
jgi:hypothetical protein